MIEDTKSELREWGKWSFMRLRGYPSTPQNTPVPAISDERALYIDSKVCRLRRKDIDAAKVIGWYFINNLHYIDIAERLRTNRKKVSNLLDSGVYWIDAAIDNEIKNQKNTCVGGPTVL